MLWPEFEKRSIGGTTQASISTSNLRAKKMSYFVTPVEASIHVRIMKGAWIRMNEQKNHSKEHPDSQKKDFKSFSERNDRGMVPGCKICNQAVDDPVTCNDAWEDISSSVTRISWKATNCEIYSRRRLPHSIYLHSAIASFCFDSVAVGPGPTKFFQAYSRASEPCWFSYMAPWRPWITHEFLSGRMSVSPKANLFYVSMKYTRAEGAFICQV